jgi:hypothetical protein
MRRILTLLVLVCVLAGAAPACARAAEVEPAEVEAHLERLVPTLAPGFIARVEHPFVVVTDASPDELDDWCRRTIRWSVQKLKAQFFDRDPDRVLEVWLLKDLESFDREVQRMFGRTPNTPYGFYSSRRGVLVMNIASGGGTLVHEIVHPFVEANFPDCPAWFNEGLGSLYEQASERDGKIVGLPNWRLKRLKAAIRAGKTRTFESLTGTTLREFYREEAGMNYAQARYLCLYLQEHGMLERYYRAFVAAQSKDPTGYATLVEVLGRPDMDAFRRDWEAWIETLEFP